MGRGMFYMFIYFIAANNAVGLFCCSVSDVTNMLEGVKGIFSPPTADESAITVL